MLDSGCRVAWLASGAAAMMSTVPLQSECFLKKTTHNQSSALKDFYAGFCFSDFEMQSFHGRNLNAGPVIDNVMSHQLKPTPCGGGSLPSYNVLLKG